MMRRALRISTYSLLLLLAAGGFAQVGRMPNRGGMGRQPKIQPGPAGQEPLATFSGIVREIDSKKLTLEESETNTLDFTCTRKTKYYDGSKQIKSAAIKPGDVVSVESKRSPDLKLDAVTVRVEHEKTAEPEKQD